MTQSELLNEYPILKDDLMAIPRKSILGLIGQDKYTDDRGFLVDICDTFADGDGDEFFWKMTPMMMFVRENPDEVTAYTTPEKLIVLNYPNHHLSNDDDDRFQRWYFIYCHECLHQMWDTFSVGEDLVKDGIPLDHHLLNIASDCVINDYLSTINTSHKIMPNGLITPDVIEQKYGVKYDNKVDNQYSLYCKIIETLNDDQKKELKKEFGDKIEPKKVTKKQGPTGPTPPEPPQIKPSKEFIEGWTDAIQDTLAKKIDPLTWKPEPDWEKQHPKDYIAGYTEAVKQIKEGLEKGIEITENPKGGGGDSNGLPPIPWKIPPTGSNGGDSDNKGEGGDSDSKDQRKNDAQDAANEAQKYADKAKELADKGDAKGAKAAADKAGDAAKKAGQLMGGGEGDEAMKEGDNAKQTANSGNSSAKDAADAAQKAADAAKKACSGSNSQKGSSGASGGQGDANGTHLFDPDITQEDIDRATRYAEETCKKYRNSITSGIGEFLEKCKAAAKRKRPSDLHANTHKGNTAWNKEVTLHAKKYVQKKIKTNPIWRRTYDREKRGSMAITPEQLRRGVVIPAGRKRIKNKQTFDLSVYIDVSGSMDHCITQVFKTAYTILDDLIHNFSKIKEIDKDNINTRMFVFDTQMKEIDYGKTYPAGGGTYSFSNLINDMKKNGSSALVNIIITDGDFSEVKPQEVANAIKELPGCVELVTSNIEGRFDSCEHRVRQTCGEGKFHVMYTDSEFTPR